MRILILALNFHPEVTGCGRYTGELALYLAQHDHSVRVVTAPPYYPHWKVQKPYRSWQYRHEKWQGMDVYRCPLWVPKHPSNAPRILHLLSFALSCVPALLRQLLWKPDVVLCVVPTLFSAPAALLIAKLTGARSWIHIQDFEVDAAAGLRMLPGQKAVYSAASGLERSLLSRFDHVSTISENMMKRSMGKGVPEGRLHFLPNWVDTRALHPATGENPLRLELGIDEGRTIVLYHGNMGRKQGLELLIDTARCLAERPDMAFVLCGDGVARGELEDYARGCSNVLFLPVQPEDRLNWLVNLADIHVLPQLPGAADLVMPSKLSGMLASGRAVVACAEPGTQLWKVVSRVGIVVPPRDVRALADALCSLADDASRRAGLGLAARKYAEEHLDREQVLGGLLEWLPRPSSRAG